MKRHRNKFKHFRQCSPPVDPVVDPVAYPELMRDLFLPHCNMNKRIAFKKKITITTVNIPSYSFFLILRHILYEGQNIIIFVIFLPCFTG